MTLADYHVAVSSSGTAHLVDGRAPTALCGFDSEGDTPLLLDIGSVSATLCTNCEREVDANPPEVERHFEA